MASWDFIRESVIKKTPGKQEYCVESESGKNMGCSDSHAGAVKRLRQVEWHKKHGAAGMLGPKHIRQDLQEFDEIDEHLGKAQKVVKEMVNEDKQALKQMASGYATTDDLGTHGDGNDDMDKYQDHGIGFQSDTDLTDRDKQIIKDCLDRGEGLPPKYRTMLFADAPEVELVWQGKSSEVTSVVLPFQSIEHIDEPRPVLGRQGETLFDADMRGRQSSGWTNKLIWGDNKLVLSSLNNLDRNPPQAPQARCRCSRCTNVTQMGQAAL